MVPYLGGTAQALNDVISGRVPMVIDAYPPIAGALQAGSIRALAVGSTKRLPDFPDLPTTGEILPGFSPNGWLALVAPVGTPDAIVRKLSDDLRVAVESRFCKGRPVIVEGVLALKALSEAGLKNDFLIFVENSAFAGSEQMAPVRPRY